MNKLSSDDVSSLLRLAASLPTGDESRRAILSGLKTGMGEPWRKALTECYVLSQNGLFLQRDGTWGPETGRRVFQTWQAAHDANVSSKTSPGFHASEFRVKDNKNPDPRNKGNIAANATSWVTVRGASKSAFTFSGLPQNEKEILMIVRDLFKMLDAEKYAKTLRLIDDGKIHISHDFMEEFTEAAEDQAAFKPKKKHLGLQGFTWEFASAMSSVTSQAEKNHIYELGYLAGYQREIGPLLAVLSKKYQDHSKGIVSEHWQKWNPETDKAIPGVEVRFTWKRDPASDITSNKSFVSSFQKATGLQFKSLEHDDSVVCTKDGGYWVRL